MFFVFFLFVSFRFILPCLLIRVQEAVGSNPATPTKNPQIFVQEAQKSEDSSFAKPGKLCETPTPGNAE